MKNLRMDELHKLEGHSNTVISLYFSPDGNALASESNDKYIHLWDVKTGQQNSKLDGHTHFVQSVCFSPDCNTLASGSWDNSIRLWDVKVRAIYLTLSQLFQRYTCLIQTASRKQYLFRRWYLLLMVFSQHQHLYFHIIVVFLNQIKLDKKKKQYFHQEFVTIDYFCQHKNI